jgi:hypothetical protein
MDIGEAAARSVDWSAFQLMKGDASQFGDKLVNFLRSSNADECREAWRHIENNVFAQDTIYSAAEPTLDVVLAALVEDRPLIRGMLIDLLFLILHGDSREDPDLSRRCRQRVLRGTWLLVRLAVTGSEGTREAVLEVLDLVDSDQSNTLRSWLASLDDGASNSSFLDVEHMDEWCSEPEPNRIKSTASRRDSTIQGLDQDPGR